MVICVQYVDSDQVSYLACDTWQEALDTVLETGRELLVSGSGSGGSNRRKLRRS